MTPIETLKEKISYGIWASFPAHIRRCYGTGDDPDEPAYLGRFENVEALLAEAYKIGLKEGKKLSSEENCEVIKHKWGQEIPGGHDVCKLCGKINHP